MENAGIVRMCLCRKLAVTVDYASLDKLQYELRREGIETGPTDYGAKVTLHLTVESDRAGALTDKITALTSGGAQIDLEEEGFFPIGMQSP